MRFLKNSVLSVLALVFMCTATRTEPLDISFKRLTNGGQFFQQGLIGKEANFLRGIVLYRYRPSQEDHLWLQGKVIAIVAGLPLPDSLEMKDEELIPVLMKQEEAQGVGVGALIDIRGLMQLQSRKVNSSEQKICFIKAHIIFVKGYYEDVMGTNCTNIMYSLYMRAESHREQWLPLETFVGKGARPLYFHKYR